MAIRVKEKSFADYKSEAHNWVTLATGEFFPDVLSEACALYGPILASFRSMTESARDSIDLFRRVCDITDQWTRIQHARAFRKFVSPALPVEMLKKKTKFQEICTNFGHGFRPIADVRRAVASRPVPDEALCAIFWEYKDRGKKGYDLTELFFQRFKELHPTLTLTGPERAGRDILMREVFPDYPRPDRPVDFVIADDSGPLAIGLARFDSDRGGAQEDDRTGGYRDCASELLLYAHRKGLRQLKVIFLNEGPGLLLGSMWDDYANLESSAPGKIKVVTLRMVQERITSGWLKSRE